MATAPYNALIHKLGNYTRLAEAEQHALVAASADVRRLGPREDVVREGEKPTRLNLVMSGFACRYKLLADGRRQVLSFLVPGDFCDYRNVLLDRMDHSISTLTEARVAMIAPEEVDSLLVAHPRIRRAFDWAQLVEQSITREWLVNVGQRTAYERTAHLFCEVFYRLQAIGQTRGMSCELPFTQIELGDTLGLTAVHVNRTLQELRREGMIVLRDRELTIPDLPALESLAVFDPAYLHLSRVEDHAPDRAALQGLSRV